MTRTREEDRRAAKRRLYMAQQGKPCLITVEETRAVREHALALHAQGMGVMDIGRLAGVSPTTVADLVNGRRNAGHDNRPVTTLRRSTYDKLMAVHYHMPRGRSSRQPAFGARRRMRALYAAGWPSLYLARELGRNRLTMNRFVLSDQQQWLFAYQRDDIAALYEKLEFADPIGTPHQVEQARRNGLRHFWAPVHCWDGPETLDDPEGYPEYTGWCGTERGYDIHIREKNPVGLRRDPCDPRKWEPVWACGNCVMARKLMRSWPELGYLMELRQRGGRGKHERDH